MAPGQRTKELRHVGRAVPLALAFVLAMGAVAFADQITGEADGDILSSPHGVTSNHNQQPGTTVEYTFSAMIRDNGGPNDNVFPGTLPVSVVRSGDWLAAGDAGSPSGLSFTGYDEANAKTGTIRVTVPCGTTSNTKKTMSATLTGGATATGKTLGSGGNNVITLNYAVTASGSDHSTCIQTPTNRAPTADAGDDVSGVEGNWVAIDGSGSNDPDGDDLTYKWTYTADAADAGTTCQFADDQAAITTVKCTDDGAFTLTLEVSDGILTDNDSATLTLTNADPVFADGKPTFASSSLSCADPTATVNFAFTDAGSNDTHTGSIDFGDGSGSRALTAEEIAAGMSSHTYNSGGPYTASVTITDDNAGSTGSTSSTNTLIVQYNLSDILQPINNTRMGQAASLFKYGSTIPVKVVVTDCDGAVPANLTLKVTWRQGLNSTPVGVEEVVPTSQPDLGNRMRFSDGQYVLQLNSKNTTADSTSGITIWVTTEETGQNTWANIGFKK